MIRLAFVVVLVAILTGCAASRPVKTPMDRIVDRSPPTVGPRALLVIMPGIREVPADLVQRGFVDAVRKRGIAADVVVADAHIGYFRDRTFLDRLRDDIVAPAKAAGYDRIWLAGISLGGFGSLLYAASEYGADVDGAIVLAPYLGPERLRSEVFAAGGLREWHGRTGPDPAERRLLEWLQGYAQPGADRPSLFIGYGKADDFAAINAEVGALLPPGHALAVPGGHAWGPWVALWDAMLDRAPLPRIVPPVQAFTPSR
jgi:hypothetical protein